MVRHEHPYVANGLTLSAVILQSDVGAGVRRRKAFGKDQGDIIARAQADTWECSDGAVIGKGYFKSLQQGSEYER